MEISLNFDAATLQSQYYKDATDLGLCKDTHSKNITIDDWNTLVGYVSKALPDIIRLYTSAFPNVMHDLNALKDRTVDNSMLEDSSVTNSKIANGSITTPKIAENSITADKLKNDSVTTETLVDRSVTNGKLADESVDRTKLTKSIQETLQKAFTSVEYDTSSGTLLFTNGGETVSIDLPFETLLTGVEYSPEHNALVLHFKAEKNSEKIFEIPLDKLIEKAYTDVENIRDEVLCAAEEVSENTKLVQICTDEVTAKHAEVTNIYDNLQAPISNHETRIKNLERHIKQDYFETDDGIAYSKLVPLNACPYAEVNKIGGMTYRIPAGTELYNGKSVLEANGEYTYEVIFEQENDYPVVVDAATNFSDYHPDGPGSDGVIFAFILADGSEAYAAPSQLPIVLYGLSKLIWINDSRAYGTVTNISIRLYTNIYKHSKVTELQSNSANLAQCAGWSATSRTLKLSNAYGTTISTVEAADRITVSQTQQGNANDIVDYNNGFFIYLLREHLEQDKKYRLSFDLKVISNPMSATKIGVKRNSESLVYVDGIPNVGATKRMSVVFAYGVHPTYPDLHLIEFRNAGMSLEISNVMITEEAVTDITYRPYGTIDTLPIPNAIISIDGYGESNPDNADEYNYIDFERKKFVAVGHFDGEAWVTYETPVETDLSEYGDLEEFIEVMSGGHLEFVNEQNQAVPSEITYLLKEV